MTILNDIHWGNTELPGLSDDKLLNTNWNFVTAARERNLDPNYHTLNSQRWQDPEWKKSHNDKVRKTVQTDDYKNSHSIGVAKRTLDPKWNEANRKARLKPIVTPYGIFNSLDSASNEIHSNRYLENRKTRLSVKAFIRSKIKIASKEFYYITHEEYIMLTGKDVA